MYFVTFVLAFYVCGFSYLNTICPYIMSVLPGCMHCTPVIPVTLYILYLCLQLFHAFYVFGLICWYIICLCISCIYMLCLWYRLFHTLYFCDADCSIYFMSVSPFVQHYNSVVPAVHRLHVCGPSCFIHYILCTRYQLFVNFRPVVLVLSYCICLLFNLFMHYVSANAIVHKL